ncbi:CU044_5270 family protein [Actinomadura sp. NAK00032]|uniref:CU044_5270 family protein n=1 Tax=Actinomadura sp. NAK00032 TaxID=2742128 RepID=UPI0015920986|nr:CU044_5270 family protein [Actinomadura sp. NAK00032]QKW32853.1 CU044_5270 family protein [Actinomadura sp. NAK00032]
MDEFQMIATMLDEPPTPETESTVRHRVLNGMREPGRPARRAWRRPVLWSGFGLAATAAAVTGAVVLSSGTAPRAPDPGHEPAAVQPMSAKTVLLTAAEHAEAAPARGKYWHVLRIQSNAFYDEQGDYWVLGRQLIGQWTRPDGRSWTGFRGLDPVPMSPKDAAPFRRAGSPDPNPISPMLDKDTGRKTFSVCDRGMTFRQVQALPTDPGELRSALKRAIPRDHPTAGRTPDEVVKNCATDLLSFVPAPPKVRAATYRMLAAMPGVTTMGAVTDERGRKGVGLHVRVLREVADTLVIDPESSFVLSTSRTSPNVPGKVDKALYLQAGWTDSAPRIPTLP